MKNKQAQWESIHASSSFNRELCDGSILATFPPMNSSGLFLAFHFKNKSTKIGEFKSMELAQDAADQYANKHKLTGALIPDDDAFWTASAAYAGALDKARHLKDAKLVAAVNAAQAAFVRAMASKPVGQKVKYGEFDATIVRICDGSLSGMLEIRVPGGMVCVGVTDVTRDRPGASEDDKALTLAPNTST